MNKKKALNIIIKITILLRRKGDDIDTRNAIEYIAENAFKIAFIENPPNFQAQSATTILI